MANKIQVKRGLKSNLPSSAAVGEPLFPTDTRELFMGTGSGVVNMGGSHWYSGTAMSGTSTTIGAYYYSDCPEVKVGDYYLNTSYGYVYECTTAGSGSNAKWTYQGTLNSELLNAKANTSHEHNYLSCAQSQIRNPDDFTGKGLKYGSLISDYAPYDSDGILVFLPYGSDSDKYGHQFYFDDESNIMYHRGMGMVDVEGPVTDWKPWRRIYDDEYHPFSVTLNGSASTVPSWYAPTTGKSGSYGGGVLYSTYSGAPSWTSYGTSGYFLKANGANSAPSWTNTLPATTYINSTSYRVVGTSTGYNTKIHVSATEPSPMSVGDIWIKLPS